MEDGYDRPDYTTPAEHITITDNLVVGGATNCQLVTFCCGKPKAVWLAGIPPFYGDLMAHIKSETIEKTDETWNGKKVYIGETRGNGHRRKVVKQECNYENCQEVFFTPISELKRDRGLYCSPSCSSKKTPTGSDWKAEKNPQYVDGNINRVQAWYQDKKEESECVRCGESSSVCLVFHHENQEEKKEAISEMVRRNVALEKIIEESKKCIILCRNCHAKEHQGQGRDSNPYHSRHKEVG